MWLCGSWNIVEAGILQNYTLIKSNFSNRYQRVLMHNWCYYSIFSNWVKVKCGIPQGAILSPLFFLLFVNDLPKIIRDISQPFLFADDASILISKPSLTEFINNFNWVFVNINDWLNINLLLLNFHNTYNVQCRTEKSIEINRNISHGNKLITSTHSIKFLGLIIIMENHTDQLMSELSKACYVFRAVKSFMSQETLKMIYFSYVHCIMTYVVFFGITHPVVTLFLRLK
jgi:hypothetical protein